jgi:hypothetical protein
VPDRESQDAPVLGNTLGVLAYTECAGEGPAQFRMSFVPWLGGRFNQVGGWWLVPVLLEGIPQPMNGRKGAVQM